MIVVILTIIVTIIDIPFKLLLPHLDQVTSTITKMIMITGITMKPYIITTIFLPRLLLCFLMPLLSFSWQSHCIVSVGNSEKCNVKEPWMKYKAHIYSNLILHHNRCETSSVCDTSGWFSNEMILTATRMTVFYLEWIMCCIHVEQIINKFIRYIRLLSWSRADQHERRLWQKGGNSTNIHCL